VLRRLVVGDGILDSLLLVASRRVLLLLEGLWEMGRMRLSMLAREQGTKSPRTYIVVVVGLSLLLLENASLAVGTVLGNLGLVQDLALDLLHSSTDLISGVGVL